MGSRFKRFTIWAIVVLVMFTLLTGCDRPLTKATETPSSNQKQTASETPEQTMNTPTPLPPTATPDEMANETPETVELATQEVETAEPTKETTAESTETTEETTETTAPPEEQTYIIAEGDTLFSIAYAHGLTLEELAARNGITDIDSIEIGQEIIIPVSGGEQTEAETGTETETSSQEGVHVVQVGENLFRIALQYDLSFETVAAYNNIPWPYYIYPGQEILIPPQ
jgi:LysM repeat protein